MATMIYVLCALTSLLCTWQLTTAYRRARSSLLLWSAACFGGLTLSNVLLVFDRVLLPQVDLYSLRLATATVAVVLLVWGMMWEDD